MTQHTLSNPYLIDVLDRVAKIVSEQPETAPVSLGSDITPAWHWWEVFEWVHKDNPCEWSQWLTDLKNGKWPLHDPSFEAELSVAVACYSGSTIRQHYKLLKDDPQHQPIKPWSNIDNASASVLEKAYVAMLDQLNQTDLDFFYLMTALDTPWYMHWHEHRNKQEVAIGATLPANFTA